MIQLHNVQYSIGQRVLFEQVNWALAPGSRVALVGPNGTGKTTLLRLVMGEIEPESGTCIQARGTRLGYLPQEAAERFDGTVLDRAMEAHKDLVAMREELDRLHQRLQDIKPDDPELEEILERSGSLQNHLEHHDEHSLEPEARRLLSGLGFSTRDQDRPLEEFSGGWRMRAALGALLLADPTLLFLDEPTNHLDLPAMQWLEDYLESFRGGLVVVSHDRVFLDRVANEVRELDAQRLHEYAMTFTFYLEERELRRERIEAQNEQLGKRITQLNRFVERFGAKNTKATQAQSKQKMIDRLREQRVVLPRRPKGVKFSFPDPPHVGKALMTLRGVAFAYDEKGDIFSDVNLDISRGDKIAIVGANGAGKTTLLRVLAEQFAPRVGTFDLHPDAKLAYFAQHAAETLNPKHTALQSLEEVAPAALPQRLRSLLGNFLMTGDDVYKKCGILSGGERQRVALARMLLEPANFILLDEPTHHLDLAGKEVLEEALEQYPGGLIVVTHDRALMARVATRVIEVDHGRAVLYPGGYKSYAATRLTRQAPLEQTAPTKPTKSKKPAKAAVKSKAKAPAKQPAGAKATKSRAAERKARAAQQKRDRELKQLETALEQSEARMRQVELQLADPEVYADRAKAGDLTEEYKRLRSEVESLWAKLEKV